ncbi:bifunctional folylpolyglutamate synthase/dihydrofolate synthase [Amedibacillus sp. YH-ame6]
MFENANEIISIIEQRKNRGNGLAHFQEYMDSIGSPHAQLKVIHVAGTNGKGSTTNDIRSILQEANYQVGTFTSPYMITHLDRIRINDNYISETDFLEIVNEYYDSWMTWNLSMFEIDMCIASVYFSRKNVDLCVFEVGLGGRLDMTNILTPMVSVITNIGMDHMELLGNTYEKIAVEKAGIMKENVPLFTAEKKESCLQIFQTIAKEKHSKVVQTSDITNVHNQNGVISFQYKDYDNVTLSSGARYQCLNAALAIEVITYLKEHHDIICDEHAIRSGLQMASWAGRFEVVCEIPRIILDGAHNTEGIQALCESIQDIHNPVVIFSVLKDKNFHSMLDELQKISDYIILTQLQHNERALDIYEIQESDMIHLVYNMEDALQQAIALHRPIIITGSLYFISDVRKLFMKE